MAGLTLHRLFLAGLLVALAGCPRPRNQAKEDPNAPFDLVVFNGRIVDGSGGAWYAGDLALRGDRIARITPRGLLADAPARRRIDAKGLVVAPGFIDILAQSFQPLSTADPRALSMVTQGVTTAILGEGTTPAPVSDLILATIPDPGSRDRASRFAGPHGFGAWLDAIGARGLSQNVGSFLGSGTARQYVKGTSADALSDAEREAVRGVVRRAMEDGAMGLASSLQYPPDNFNTTEDLINAAKAMAPFGGVYATHMRSEANRLLEGIDEALHIGSAAGVPVEIHHLKAAGPRNWNKAAAAIAKIEAARAAGQDVQANMYAYVAASNSFSSCIPPRYASDGRLLQNLADPTQRAQIVAALHAEDPSYDNACLEAGPDRVMVVGFRQPELQQYEGKRLSEIATSMGKDWAEAIVELNLAERAKLKQILFLMSEDNVRAQLRQPWMKWGTDASAQDPAQAKAMTHPRAYGNYPRLLGKYVREEKVLSLEEAVRKATSAVAARLSIRDRGLIAQGMKADLVIFDPDTIAERATFEQPHQLSVGVRDVIVNGVEVLRDGVHTNAAPGQIVRGPGWRR